MQISYKKRILYLIGLVLFSITFSCTSIKKMNYLVDEKKHEPSELIKDVDYTYKVLTNGHPGVYWYIEKEQLDFKFDSLKQSLTIPLTTKEFYKKLAPIIAEVKCGHTRLILVTKKLTINERNSLEKLNKPINQFAYKVLNNKLYVNSSNKKLTEIKKGDEIISINGITSTEIINNITKNYASDGYNQTFKTAVLNRAFIGWYNTIYSNKDTLTFKIKKADSIFNLTLTTTKSEQKADSLVKIKKVVKLSKDSLLAKRKIAKEKLKSRYKGLDENKKPMLDLQFLDQDSSVAYLKVKSFSFPHADFSRFYKESFTAIKQKGTQNLIIDLRDNGGGSLTACRNLFSYLVDKDFVYLKQGMITHKFNPYLHSKGIKNALLVPSFELADLIRLKKQDGKYKVRFKGLKPLAPNPNHFSGKIYVLINGYSFSASTLLSANLKQLERATFVGEETGGGFNGCVAGYIPILDLPYSKLKLRMGLYPILPNAHTETIGRGIFPDQEIINTVEDLISGKDKELDWVLNDLKKSNIGSNLK
jgi:C-terminal processing protease CtpA/Prc